MVSSAVRLLFLLQATQATVAGTVRDGERHLPLAGAVVVLTDLDRSTTTDATGRYRFQEVPAGPHHLTIRSIGFHPRTLHGLVPRDGELEINISLERTPIQLRPLEVRAAVVVRGAAGDSTAFPDRGASIAAIRNHPLLAEADVLQALGGGEVVLRPESPSGVHVRGGASDQTAYLLDGVPVFSPYHSAGIFSAWNPDAIAGLSLASSAPSPADPDVLSGVVSAVTRAPGATVRIQGGLSNTQVRLTADGPLGTGGAGFLLSWRSGLPTIIAPRGESSYLGGETGDWLAKAEAKALGGRVRLLGYDTSNEITAAITADSGADRGRRNAFDWRSRSLGAEWTGTVSGTGLRFLGWNATSDAGSDWSGHAGSIQLVSARRDRGLLASATRRSLAATTSVGIRLQGSRTSYRLRSLASDLALEARTPTATLFAEQSRAVGERVRLDAALALTGADGDLYLGPRATARWQPSQRLTLTGSYARLHQFAQSLRNPESVVSTVFPVDLFLGAERGRVPVGQSDQGVIGLDYRPGAGTRLGAQVYRRGLDGLVLVAPRDGEPFSTSGFETGSGTAGGLAIEASMSGARVGIVASYGWQQVRWRYGASRYVPDHGAAHSVDAGVIVFPSGTSSIRFGVSGAFGRHGTPVAGGLEWEACNLLDRGCEFAGSPVANSAAPGSQALPGYLRADVGVRKHWHVAVGGRDAEIALFGTVTNVFGRRNVLTFATDPSTGALSAIEMRPRAPLVIGIDWRF